MQQFLRRMSVGRLVLAGAAMVALALPGAAQQAAPQTSPSAPAKSAFQVDYSKPASHFPNPIAPYLQRLVPAPNLTNTPRIDQLMKEGKLMLSMNDAIALALENNLDIAIARYNRDIADTDIL
jgi:outer membrane protein